MMLELLCHAVRWQANNHALKVSVAQAIVNILKKSALENEKNVKVLMQMDLVLVNLVIRIFLI